MIWWTALAALAAPPVVEVAWDRDRHWLEVAAPEGTVVDAVPPLTLALAVGERSYEVTTDGQDLADGGVALRDLRGQQLQGTLSVTLCAKADGTCTPTTWSVAGQVGEGRKGRSRLSVAPPLVVSHDEPEVFNTDASQATKRAFAEAAATNKPLLIDFSAVWCPPCNLLSAEVLHAQPPPPVLDDYVVLVVDVDHPSANDLKARYDVGGYPTVVVTGPDGTERSRRVGYEGRDAFVRWLSGAAGADDAADLQAGPDAVEPERALQLAWQLLGDRRFELARAFAARGEGVDSALARRVRASLEPSPDDVRWLLEHDVEHVDQWFGVAMELAADHPELAAEVAGEAVRRIDGPGLADALYVQAKVTERTELYAVAASALRTALSGDPERDRGHLTWLAHLTALSGDLEGALQILDEARSRWPDEPTWDLSAAYRLSEAERPAEALEAAERAAASAWGDNALRVATVRAEALVALERHDEAEQVVAEALAAVPAPDDELAVRTHRYRERLAAVVADPP
jgi:tetratricopeptide (TPR) repeat protein